MRRVSLLLLVGILAVVLATSVLAEIAPPTTTPTVVEGTITAISRISTTVGKITVSVPSVTPTTPVRLVTILVNAKTVIYKNGSLVTLAALAVGDTCRATVIKTAEGGLLATLIYAKTAPLKTVSGVIAEKVLYNGARTFRLSLATTTARMWFSVNGDTRITVDGKPATYDQLAKGQNAEVAYKQPPPLMTPVEIPIPASVVTARNVVPPPPPVYHVKGRLAFVDALNRVIGVKPATPTAGSNVIMQFKVTDLTKIEKFGPALLKDLTPAGTVYAGDQVDVAYPPLVIESITPPVAVTIAVSPEIVAGSITSIKPLERVFTLSIPTPATTPPYFTVVTATRITRNGVPVGLGDLRIGDLAGVRYFQFWSEKRAAVVEARAPLIGTTIVGTRRL